MHFLTDLYFSFLSIKLKKTQTLSTESSTLLKRKQNIDRPTVPHGPVPMNVTHYAGVHSENESQDMLSTFLLTEVKVKWKILCTVSCKKALYYTSVDRLLHLHMTYKLVPSRVNFIYFFVPWICWDVCFLCLDFNSFCSSKKEHVTKEPGKVEKSLELP